MLILSVTLLIKQASVGGFSVPFSLSLCDGAVAIVNEVQQENPNHAHISAQLVFISEALTDINTMFSESGKNLEGDINELENLLRRADGKIGACLCCLDMRRVRKLINQSSKRIRRTMRISTRRD